MKLVLFFSADDETELIPNQHFMWCLWLDSENSWGE